MKKLSVRPKDLHSHAPGLCDVGDCVSVYEATEVDKEIARMSIDVTELAGAALKFRHAHQELTAANQDVKRLKAELEAAHVRADEALSMHSEAQAEVLRLSLEG